MTTPRGYRDLADLLRTQIATGDLAPGQRLPAEITLAQTYDLSLTTVRRAVAVLRHEGLIDVRQGYPSRVRDLTDLEDVRLPPTRVTARMPTPADRQRWGDIPDGCAMLVALDLPQGWPGPDAWPSHRFRLDPRHG